MKPEPHKHIKNAHDLRHEIARLRTLCDEKELDIRKKVSYFSDHKAKVLWAEISPFKDGAADGRGAQWAGFVGGTLLSLMFGSKIPFAKTAAKMAFGLSKAAIENYMMKGTGKWLFSKLPILKTFVK
jgi:hypothetical protein